ncbi:MAG TPA: alpha-amylase family glycosyl hydrolase, partial [Steroidobacteraceae bacterium]|nr:alpha-amylase family glycosyl hydrolase [Steroidobacteraceae bacterium]
MLYGAAPYQFEPQGFGGIRERLDEIAALGASAVWLSPVTAAAEDDFGYAVLDQFSIRADFGGEAGL